MIHAHIFTKGWHRRDGDHGPRFRTKMTAINLSTVPDTQVCAMQLSYILRASSRRSTLSVATPANMHPKAAAQLVLCTLRASCSKKHT